MPRGKKFCRFRKRLMFKTIHTWTFEWEKIVFAVQDFSAKRLESTLDADQKPRFFLHRRGFYNRKTYFSLKVVQRKHFTKRLSFFSFVTTSCPFERTNLLLITSRKIAFLDDDRRMYLNGTFQKLYFTQ